MEVQLRSDEGEIWMVETLAEALRQAKKNQNIWKISFSLPNKERVRLVGRGDTFVLRQFPTADEILKKAPIK